MKFLILLAALATVAVAEIHVYVDNKEVVDTRLQALDVLKEFTVKSGEVHDNEVEDIEGKNIVNDKIIAFLEQARENFGVGFPNSGIPPLDPLKMGPISLKYSFPLLFKATLTIKNGILTGLQQFIIQNIHFNILRLTFDFDMMVPELRYGCRFDVDGKITLVVPFDFGGTMRMTFKRFRMAGKTDLATTLTGHLTVKEFFLNFEVERTSIYFDGVIGNGPLNDIFNWLLSQLTNGTIKKIVEGVSESLTIILREALDKALANVSLADLLG